MNNKIIVLITGLLSLGLGIVIGTFIPENEGSAVKAPSAYVSLLDTEIRGLDQDTIEGYLTGKGLGQALPAELNGYPGPRHTIDMAEELELTEEQLAQVQALFDDMQTAVIPLGEKYLESVAELELTFREGTITDQYLQSQLEKITATEAQMRYVHLSTHLATIDILSHDQIMQYNMMRGYGDGMDHEQHQNSGDS
jgi:Spy/CpxP family protein refolding chaperone